MINSAIRTLINSPKRLTARRYSKETDPFTKTWKVLGRDMPAVLGMSKNEQIYPEHADVVIIGGGIIGSSIAYSLKSRAVHGLNVVVLEKDLTYQNFQTHKSLGCLTQHFSLIENIKLAQYGAEFLRNVKMLLSKDVDLQYHPTGSLVLASENFAEKLEFNASIMREQGQRLDLLTPKQIQELYPWINVSDIKLGCQNFESEGTFNSWELLKGYIFKSVDLGAQYVNAEVTGFILEGQSDVLMEGVEPGTYKRINNVVYRTPDGKEKSIKFAACVLAAGHESGNIAKMANIGTGEGMLSFQLPIAKRECSIYGIENKATQLGLSIPMINDTSGLWLRRNGLDSQLQFGMTPLPEDNTEGVNDYYKDIILASLTNRLPCSKEGKITRIQTVESDWNKYDDSGILGSHPYYNNLYVVTGFGNLACAHSPGIGRAVSELIIDSHFKTTDLTRFGFDRFLVGEAVIEFNIY